MIVRGLINIRVPNTKCEHTLQYIGKQPNQVMKTYITQRNQVIITPHKIHLVNKGRVTLVVFCHLHY